MAQSERQRIVRHLARCETELREARHRVARGERAMYGFATVSPPTRVAELESDVAALTARLRELLDGAHEEL